MGERLTKGDIEKIQAEIDEQDKIRKEIQLERNKRDEIIESAIK